MSKNDTAKVQPRRKRAKPIQEKIARARANYLYDL